MRRNKVKYVANGPKPYALGFGKGIKASQYGCLFKFKGANCANDPFMNYTREVKRGKFPANDGLNTGDLLQIVFFFNQSYAFERHGAGQRIGHKSRPMHKRLIAIIA